MNQPPNTAEIYDSALRWTVASRTNPGETYMVDLGAYGGEGRCACQDFSNRYEKYLQRGYTPRMVWDEKWITKLRDYQLDEDDCLSCWHLVNARRMTARHVVRAFNRAKLG